MTMSADAKLYGMMCWQDTVIKKENQMSHLVVPKGS